MFSSLLHMLRHRARDLGFSVFFFFLGGGPFPFAADFEIPLNPRANPMRLIEGSVRLKHIRGLYGSFPKKGDPNIVP